MKKLQVFFGSWIGIVIALAATIILFTLIFAAYYPNYVANRKPTTYQSKQECETATGKSCLYAQCDYKCDIYFSGWLPVKN